MNTKELLRALNPRLFEEEIPAERFIPILIGEIGEKLDGDKKVKTIQLKHRTKPSNAAKEAGMTSQSYYRVMMESYGVLNITTDGVKELRTKKKPYPHMVFANTQVNIFSFIDQIVQDWKNAETQEEKDTILQPMGKTSDGEPRFKVLKTILWGKWVSVNVPKYIPQVRGEDGKDRPFTAIKRNPKTGKYEKEPVIMSVIRFWADEDDLTELEIVAEKFYENRVEPNLSEKVTIITEKGSKITQEISEPKVTLTDDQLEKESETTESETTETDW